MAKKNILLIGIDGGATKVAAWQVNAEDNGKTFSLGDKNAVVNYNQLPDFDANFTPQLLNTQLSEFRAHEIKTTPDEDKQGEVYISACSKAVASLAQSISASTLLLGIGMPGLKTADKRGIAVLVNGPRIPEYAACLEEKLKQAGISLAAPIHKLGSDADYCGIGENYAKHSNFSNIQSAYYLGGGTGAADAMKLNGRLLPFDDAKAWIAKSWEMQNDHKISLEKYASAAGIQYIYAQNAGRTLQEIQESKLYPHQIAEQALTGDKPARQTFTDIANNLSLLLYERITTLHCGWQNLFSFVNAGRAIPQKEHPFLGNLFDRIIIGQRLSELMRSRPGQELLTIPLLDTLSRLINDSTCLDEQTKAHHLHGTIFRSERLVFSTLREAAALGAAIDAYQRFIG
jgi:predicted NBD/HSP70 family sugar kinase